MADQETRQRLRRNGEWKLGPFIITKGSLPRLRRYRGTCERCPHEAHDGSCFGRAATSNLLCGCGALDGLFDEDDFYEEDEDPQKVIDAFDRGEKGLTGQTDVQAMVNAYELAHTNAWTWNPLTGHMEPMSRNG